MMWLNTISSIRVNMLRDMHIILVHVFNFLLFITFQTSTIRVNMLRDMHIILIHVFNFLLFITFQTLWHTK